MVRYPCFPDAALSHRDARPAAVRLYVCLSVEKVATERQSWRGDQMREEGGGGGGSSLQAQGE